MVSLCQQQRHSLATSYLHSGARNNGGFSLWQCHLNDRMTAGKWWSISPNYAQGAVIVRKKSSHCFLPCAAAVCLCFWCCRAINLSLLELHVRGDAHESAWLMVCRTDSATFCHQRSHPAAQARQYDVVCRYYKRERSDFCRTLCTGPADV